MPAAAFQRVAAVQLNGGVAGARDAHGCCVTFWVRDGNIREGNFQVVIRVVDDVHRVAGDFIAARHLHVVVLVVHGFVLGHLGGAVAVGYNGDATFSDVVNIGKGRNSRSRHQCRRHGQRRQSPGQRLTFFPPRTQGAWFRTRMARFRYEIIEHCLLHNWASTVQPFARFANLMQKCFACSNIALFSSRFYSFHRISCEILLHKKAAAQNLHNSLSILQQLFFRCNDLQKIPMKLLAA